MRRGCNADAHPHVLLQPLLLVRIQISPIWVLTNQSARQYSECEQVAIVRKRRRRRRIGGGKGGRRKGESPHRINRHSATLSAILLFIRSCLTHSSRLAFDSLSLALAHLLIHPFFSYAAPLPFTPTQLSAQ